MPFICGGRRTRGSSKGPRSLGQPRKSSAVRPCRTQSGHTESEEAFMMNDTTTSSAQPAAVNPPGKLAYATPTTAPLVAGRRSFFKYRDLGVTAASSGKIRAQVTIGAD